MKNKGKKRWLRKREFNKIKKLLEIGLSMVDISKVLGRSYHLITRVNKVKDWDEYVANKKEYAEGKRKEKEEEKEAIALAGTRPTVDIAQEFVAIREALTNIERAIQ